MRPQVFLILILGFLQWLLIFSLPSSSTVVHSFLFQQHRRLISSVYLGQKVYPKLTKLINRLRSSRPGNFLLILSPGTLHLWRELTIFSNIYFRTSPNFPPFLWLITQPNRGIAWVPLHYKLFKGESKRGHHKSFYSEPVPLSLLVPSSPPILYARSNLVYW